MNELIDFLTIPDNGFDLLLKIKIKLLFFDGDALHLFIQQLNEIVLLVFIDEEMSLDIWMSADYILFLAYFWYFRTVGEDLFVEVLLQSWNFGGQMLFLSFDVLVELDILI